MEKIIKIENLTFCNEEEKILNNIDLTFFKGFNTFLCGTSGSGKTSLLKAIDKKIKYEGNIICYSKVKIVYDKNTFNANTVEDELKYLSLSDEQKKFVLTFFNEQKLKFNPNNLSFREKKILLICSVLYKNPDVIFIDNLFSFLTKDDVKMFKDYFNKKGITLINVSNNIEDVLDYPYMIVMDKGIVAIEGQTKHVLKEEKILKRLGIGLPFYVDLSIQLKLYNLIDKIYLNKEELAGSLWK